MIALCKQLGMISVAIVCLYFPMSQVQTAELSDQQVLDILAQPQPRDKAIDRALAFLRQNQLDTGAFAEGQNNVAITSLAIMAHLAAGVTFDDPQHGDNLRRSLAWVISRQGTNKHRGYFGAADGSRMYGHGIATLMLAEAFGMTDDPTLEARILESLQPAIALIINAAKVPKNKEHQGGWRYEPTSKDSDLSLSGWQLMGLHAAQQVGIEVPKDIIDKAVEYAQRKVRPDGGVGYTSANRDHPALRGLGALCFAINGQEDAEEVERIVQRIRRDPIQWKGPWVFYRAYYDAVGVARSRPEAWEHYGNHLEDLFIDKQSEDGSWPSPPSDNEVSRFGKVYATAMATLALSVNRHVLPAYQR